MKYIITITVLWLIAIVTTILFVGKADAFNYIGPVYFICMVGSIITMKKALAK